MDRIAALADIVPPAAPPAPPPAAWWQHGAVWLVVLVAALVLVWALLWRRRSRGWRALRTAARQALQPQDHPSQAALRLAAALRAQLPEASWPPALRQTLDALRFAPQPSAQALQQVAADIAAASEQAIRMAAWRPARAQAAFIAALHAAAESAAAAREPA
ncbi:MAG: hypothetical protein ACP5RV_03350 [Thiomonas sp.]